MRRILLLYLIPLVAFANEPRCPQSHVLKPADPVYQDAMGVGASLAKAGVSVECVLPSKMIGMFEHQTGAAFFRTKLGDLELLVLTEPYTFDGDIIERQEMGCYRYAFHGNSGSPTVGGSLGESCSRRLYFIKQQNRLFMTMDKNLAAKLKDVFAAN